jgi:hypothetical protein
MRQTLKIVIVCLSMLALSACGGGQDFPEPEPTMSFEELESRYAQMLGVTACVEFGGGNYENAARYFRILEAIVPAWEGYADGVLREGKSFDARNCY